MRTRTLLVLGIVGLNSFASFSATYSVEVLPAYGSAGSLVVTDINDNGWLTGYYPDGNYFRSVVWNTQEWVPVPGFSAKSTFAWRHESLKEKRISRCSDWCRRYSL